MRRIVDSVNHELSSTTKVCCRVLTRSFLGPRLGGQDIASSFLFDLLICWSMTMTIADLARGWAFR